MKRFIPRDFQSLDIQRATSGPGGFGLWWEPGSGKTVTGLTIADRLLNDQFAVERVLVTGPRMVAQEVWWREAGKWEHLKNLQTRLITFEDFGYKRQVKKRVRRGVTSEVMVVRPGDAKAVRRALLDCPEQIHVVSRDHLFNLVQLMGKAWPYRMMIGDESSGFKDSESKRSKAVAFLRRKGLLDWLMLLSGTPSPKGLEQLWAQVLLLDGGERLGSSLTQFRARFMVPGKKGKGPDGNIRVFRWDPVPGAVEEVAGLIADICSSVQAKAWRENEEPITVERRVTLPPRARELYDRLARDSVLEIGATVTAVNSGVLHGKLCQLASGILFDRDKVCHEIHEAKLDALEEYIEELDGEPVVVLYWFKPNRQRLLKRFPQAATTSTPGFLDKFSRREIPVLLLNPASAGHGLDGLQFGGHHVAVYDLITDWELYKQSIDRLDRGGQKHRVTVAQFIADGTLDGYLGSVLADRGAGQSAVLEAVARAVEDVLRGNRNG